MPHERRHFVRVQFDSPAQLTCAQGVFDVQILDLSLKGALLLAANPISLAAGTPCQLTVQLSEQDHIAMRMEIVHTEGPSMGLRCDSIDLDSVTHLRRLIELQLGDPALLERDLAELSVAH